MVLWLTHKHGFRLTQRPKKNTVAKFDIRWARSGNILNIIGRCGGGRGEDSRSNFGYLLDPTSEGNFLLRLVLPRQLLPLHRASPSELWVKQRNVSVERFQWLGCSAGLRWMICSQSQTTTSSTYRREALLSLLRDGKVVAGDGGHNIFDEVARRLRTQLCPCFSLRSWL